MFRSRGVLHTSVGNRVLSIFELFAADCSRRTENLQKLSFQLFPAYRSRRYQNLQKFRSRGVLHTSVGNRADDQLLICLLFQPDIIVVCTVSISSNFELSPVGQKIFKSSDLGEFCTQVSEIMF